MTAATLTGRALMTDRHYKAGVATAEGWLRDSEVRPGNTREAYSALSRGRAASAGNDPGLRAFLLAMARTLRADVPPADRWPRASSTPYTIAGQRAKQ